MLIKYTNWWRYIDWIVRWRVRRLNSGTVAWKTTISYVCLFRIWKYVPHLYIYTSFLFNDKKIMKIKSHITLTSILIKNWNWKMMKCILCEQYIMLNFNDNDYVFFLRENYRENWAWHSWQWLKKRRDINKFFFKH